jgi:hypothetical protein
MDVLMLVVVGVAAFASGVFVQSKDAIAFASIESRIQVLEQSLASNNAILATHTRVIVSMTPERSAAAAPAA